MVIPENNFNIQGLNHEQVTRAREKHGPNLMVYKKENRFLNACKSILKEPMVLLLLAASLIYLVSGETGDAIFMAAAILFVAAISLYQDSRSRNALEKLKDYTQPVCRVIRDGTVEEIRSEELVVGDCLMVEEGTMVMADGKIIHSNDFSVDESVLTGESLPVFKDKTCADNMIYAGTTVGSGLAVAEISHTGNSTKLGRIGKSLAEIPDEKTPLEVQINRFVKRMALAGAVVFMVVWVINYFDSYNILDSLLKALTLAMSILPEEIPVAFTTFMALGAWRLMKMGVVVKQMKTVETLGSATVICVDKTGTITENRMELAGLFTLQTGKTTDPGEEPGEAEKSLIASAMWASEPIPFDAMEKALHEAYAKLFTEDSRPFYKMLHEYPLNGKPPMMTHVFGNGAGNRIIAAKGAPEAIMTVSQLSETDRQRVSDAIQFFTGKGYRVLGVGTSDFSGNNFPQNQQELSFSFRGLVAFYDPPKKNISKVLQDFYNAGLSVKIITGDNAETAKAIAKQINFRGYDKTISGNELMELQEGELQDCVMHSQVFSRMFPEAKLKIINALKAEGQVVAMTGDGVNDGPALKAAHIGIAMGKSGTGIAKQAASLILIEDDLSKMVEAVAMGRRIYTNLKKAIRYIISIHIPIILTVFIPLALGWIYPNIFSPLHIIFLELIMGPTCSIIYENEPMEKNTMQQKPRPFSNDFFNLKELSTSIIQGLVIAAGTLFVYRYAVAQGHNEAVTRSMTFTVLVVANIFLTLVNRSFYYSILTTLKYRNNMVPLIIFVTVALTGLVLFADPLSGFFEFEAPDPSQLMVSVFTGFISVTWFELVKWIRRRRNGFGPEGQEAICY